LPVNNQLVGLDARPENILVDRVNHLVIAHLLARATTA